MKSLKVISFFLLTICLTSALSVLSAKPVLADIAGDMTHAFNKGQIKELSGLYTRDAVVMPPSSEILTGWTAISHYWEGLRQAGFREYNIYNVELRTVGDIAYQTGLWQAIRKDPAGNIIRLEGNISNVLTREKNGNWKIKMQSWN